MVCSALPVAAYPSAILQRAQSVTVTPRSPHLNQKLQRAFWSVDGTETLHEGLLAAMRSTNGGDLRFRQMYCEALATFITGDGERSRVTRANVIPLALEGRLFDLIHQLATSMSSQDHVAVLPVLRALVSLVRNGAFDKVSLPECSFSAQNPLDGPLLGQMIKVCRGSIPTKAVLLAHLEYYLHYLYAVSPTEGLVFGEVSRLVHELKMRARDDFSGTKGVVSRSSEPTLSPTEPLSTIDTPCYLCKYSVPGHIHATSKPQAAGKTITDTTYSSPPAPAVKILFGAPGSPHSPIFREMETFLSRLGIDYDRFGRKDTLTACQDNTLTPKFFFGDLYDAIGAAHDAFVTHRSSSTNVRHQLLGVMNDTLQDTSCLVSYAHLMAIHSCLLPTSSGQAGVIRTSTAVGYESSCVYHVFLPAEEISDALQKFLHVLNDGSRWVHRSLLRAYYAFAVLVFFIHPFHDGNGRCARLLGNLVALKLGSRAVLRAADKTLQLPQFLQKSIVAMENARASRL